MRGIALFFLIIIFSNFSFSKSAVSLLKNALAREPNNIEYRIDLAGEYYRAGFYHDAIKEYKKILEKEKSNEYVLHHIILSYLKLSDYKNASLYAKKLNSKNKMLLFSIYSTIAQTAYNNRDFKYSEYSFKKAYTLYKKDYTVNFYLGFLLFSKRNYKKALFYFQNAYNVIPAGLKEKEKNDLLYNIIISAINVGMDNYYNKNLKIEAAKAFDIAIKYSKKLSPSYADDTLSDWLPAYFLRAKIYVDFKDYYKAKALYFFVYDKKNDLIGLIEDLSSLAQAFEQEKKDYLSAIECYARVIAQNYDDTDYIYAIAGYYVKQKDYEHAFWYLKELLNKNDKDEEHLALYNRVSSILSKECERKAKKFFKEGNKEKAFLFFSKAYFFSKEKKYRNMLDKVGLKKYTDNEYFIAVYFKNKREIKKNAELYYELALYYFEKGAFLNSYLSFKKAVALYYPDYLYKGLYLKLFPIISSKKEQFITRIEYAVVNGDKDLAVSLLSKLKKIVNDDEYKYYARKITEIRKKRYDIAYELYKNGVYYYKKAYYTKAKYYFTKTLKYNAYGKSALKYLKLIKNKEKKIIEREKKRYLEALKKENRVEMKVALTNILFIDSKNGWAKSELLKLKKGAPKDLKEKAKELYLTGIQFYTSGKYKKALEVWMRLRKFYPDYKNVKIYIKRAKDKIK